MRAIISFLLGAVLLTCGHASAQTESIDEVYIELDSIRTPYRPQSKPYVFVRSKKGKSGVNRTPEADVAVKYPVGEIVLVFTEDNPQDLAEREEANYARWENLFKTYPEFFQHSSSFMSICQCNPRGDTATFKKVQGFYIYYEGDEIAVTSTSSVTAPGTGGAGEPAKKPETAAAPVPDPPVKKEAFATDRAEETPAKKETAEKEKAAVAEAPAKAAEPEPEPERSKTTENNSGAVSSKEASDEEPEATEPPPPPKPKPVAKKGPKVRKAIDPKACRPACFGYGDADLDSFFADNLKLSKKQKKKAKKATATLNLQLNPDGSIKKSSVTGTNPEINEAIQSAAQSMGSWNAAVKNGVAIKSQVKITLKYDKDAKNLKPSGIMIIPKPGPKCRCVSDEEIFGSAD